MLDIPFRIPSEYLSQYGSGELIRTGALLKDASSGRIVAHLQESGVAQQLISQLPGGALTSPLSAAVDGYNTLQLAKLQQMIQTMQLLQYANIGISLAGIGVSVVGFAMVNKKLRHIEESIARMVDRVDRHFQLQYEEKLRWVFAHIAGLFEKADIARKLEHPKAEYLSVSSALTDQSALIGAELKYRLALETFDEELFNLLSRTLLMVNAARVEVLLAADEMDAAHETARKIGNTYQALFDPLSPRDLTAKRNYTNYFHESGMLVYRPEGLNKMKELVGCFRDITDSALTKPLLIESLDRQGIRGSDFISSLRNEQEHPILLLPEP